MYWRNARTGWRMRCVGMSLWVLGGIAVLTLFVMELWNSLIPNLFAGVAPVGYWQALGLLVLCRILFGGLRGGPWGRCHGPRREHEGLSMEERSHFKRHLQRHFHRHHGDCCGWGRGEGPEGDQRPEARDSREPKVGPEA